MRRSVVTLLLLSAMSLRANASPSFYSGAFAHPAQTTPSTSTVPAPPVFTVFDPTPIVTALTNNSTWLNWAQNAIVMLGQYQARDEQSQVSDEQAFAAFQNSTNSALSQASVRFSNDETKESNDVISLRNLITSIPVGPGIPSSIAGAIPACSLSGVYGIDPSGHVQGAGDTGCVIGWVVAQEHIFYTLYIPTAGTYTVTARAASGWGTGPGTFHLELNGVNLTGSLQLPTTGATTTYQTTTFARQATLPAGIATLAVVAEVNGFNLSWIQLTGAQ